MKARVPAPPRLARWLLARLRLGDRRADVVADLGELFEARAASRGLRYARGRYWFDVLSLFRRPQHPARPHPGAYPRTGVWRQWPVDAYRDLTHAARLLRKRAGIVALAVAGLAVAIGVSTAVFSVVNAFNFRAIGVAEPDRAVRVERNERSGRRGWTVDEYRELRASVRLTTLEFSRVAILTITSMPGEAGRSVAGRYVSGGLMQTFGGRTVIGRGLQPTDDDPGAPAVAVIHYVFWKSRFASDPDVVNRTIYVNGLTPVTIVGVLARDFTGPYTADNFSPEILLPMSQAVAVGAPDDPTSAAEIVGRLPSSSALAQAQAEISAVSLHLEPIRNEFTSEDQGIFAVLMTLVGLMLALASANVANLLKASALTRRLEIGARLALGASRGRIGRMLLTESVMLGALGGMAGAVCAAWLTPFGAHLVNMPAAVDVSLDWRVYTFVTGISLVVGFWAGLAPARFGARGDVTEALKGGSVQTGAPVDSSRTRASLIGLQAAASLLLLVLTALSGRALLKASRTDVGFDIDNLVAISATAPTSRATPQFWTDALARVNAIPGVVRSARVEDPPFGFSFHPISSVLQGQPYPLVLRRTSEGYFDTLGLRVLRGRTYTASEVITDAPVALISERLARDYFGGADALGLALDSVSPSLKSVRVIGIVSDALQQMSPPSYYRAAIVYRPLADAAFAQAIVRVEGGSAATARTIQAAVETVDVERRASAQTIRDGYDGQLKGPRILASATGIIGGLALSLAAIGIFGATAFAVTQRRREIGVRMAIGASRRQVVRLIVGQGLRPILFGLLAGVAAAFAATPVIGRVLFGGITAHDPASFAVAIVVVLSAALLGIVVPARRAAGVEPSSALREG